MSLISNNALKRLMRDWKQLQADPIPYVVAQPIETDMFCWHCNLFPQNGPYASIVFHCILQFPQNYPSSPPKVMLCTPISHPNIFEYWSHSPEGYSFICLDLLQDYYKSVPYTGWSSAYNVSSLLMQLSAFIFDSEVPQMYNELDKENNSNDYRIPRYIQQAKTFECKTCSHTFAAPVPSNSITTTVSTQIQPVIIITNSNVLNQLDTALTHHWLQYLNYMELRVCTCVDQYHVYVIKSKRLLSSKKLICFHRRVAFNDQENEEAVVLGFGFNVEYHETTAHSRVRSIKACTAVFDLLSYEAFEEDHIRLGVWKEPFEYFVPLIITASHSIKAFEILEATVTNLFPFTRGNPQVLASQMLFLITNLLNSTVVAVMNTSEANTNTTRRNRFLTLYASEKAMMGYTHLHHLLIAIVLKFPFLQQEVELKLEHFIQDPSSRIKRIIPNLGEFLLYLAISNKYSWSELSESFLDELMIRQVLWLIRKCPELLSFAPSRRTHRLHESFNNNLTSFRLIAFQVYFLISIRPDSSITLWKMYDTYNKRLGMARGGTSQELQLECQEIMEMKEYDQWFDRLHIERKTRIEQEQMLIRAIKESERLKYHKPSPVINKSQVNRSNNRRPLNSSTPVHVNNHFDLLNE
jgi:ubiquitin-protein ligase